MTRQNFEPSHSEKSSEPCVFICSTISKDNTLGEDARKSRLLAGYGQRLQRTGVFELKYVLIYSLGSQFTNIFSELIVYHNVAEVVVAVVVDRVVVWALGLLPLLLQLVNILPISTLGLVYHFLGLILEVNLQRSNPASPKQTESICIRRSSLERTRGGLTLLISLQILRAPFFKRSRVIGIFLSVLAKLLKKLRLRGNLLFDSSKNKGNREKNCSSLRVPRDNISIFLIHLLAYLSSPGWDPLRNPSTKSFSAPSAQSFIGHAGSRRTSRTGAKRSVHKIGNNFKKVTSASPASPRDRLGLLDSSLLSLGPSNTSKVVLEVAIT
jgi:hypothetical protein